MPSVNHLDRDMESGGTVRADERTAADITALVKETYRRMSTPGSKPGEMFTHPDIAVAGSTVADLMYGPEVVGPVSAMIADSAFTWTPKQIMVWREGDVAWAQILGSVNARVDGVEKLVPYWTTGVFARDDKGWHWRYWGGSHPHEKAWV